MLPPTRLVWCVFLAAAACRPGGTPTRAAQTDSAALADSTVATDSGARTEAGGGTDSGSPAAPRGVLEHYDLGGAPSWQIKLPKELDEISGLAFTADGRLFAHGDQNATIWQLDARSGKLIKTFTVESEGKHDDPDAGKKAAKKHSALAGDFEDIQIVGDRFFLISSNGTLVEFREGADDADVPYTSYDTGLSKVCEIEGLAYDESSRALLILCKHPHTKKLADQVVVFAWSLDRKSLDDRPRIDVPYSKLAPATHADVFHGSAFTFAPDRRSLMLVAGPQETFAELDMNGALLGGGVLDKGSHRQPEGIAFAPDGTLLISDEAAGKRATLTGYARH